MFDVQRRDVTDGTDHIPVTSARRLIDCRDQHPLIERCRRELYTVRVGPERGDGVEVSHTA